MVNKGIVFWNGNWFIIEESVMIVKLIMIIAGLYDELGEFFVYVGVFVKSGVGGGLMVVVLNCYGIGVFSLVLDLFGNSVVGI